MAMLSLTLAAVGSGGAAAPVTLVEKGQPHATIVISLTASDQAKQAAQELQTYIEKMSGAKLPIVTEAENVTGKPIYVGLSKAVEAMNLRIPSGFTYDFSDEGYVIRVTPAAVVLAGNETPPYLGTLYAVYDFLDSLGCRWYFPGDFGEVVPHRGTIAVAPRSEVHRPELRVRDVWYSGHLAATAQQQAEFQTWKLRTRHCRADFYLNCQLDYASWLQNPTDDSTWRLLPKEKYWSSHPEYYSMNPGGGRNERFICMSNPGALQAATDTLVEFFDQHPDFHTFAFSPPDAPVLCHCPECIRTMNGSGFGGEGNGQASDAYFRLMFELADRLAQKRPDKWIASMAYYNRCRPPEGVEGKRRNVYVQLASIQQCSLHCYTDKGCWSRQQYAAMLRRWAELTSGQVFYEYDPHDWSHLQRPCWRSQGIAEDFRLLKQLGGWGFSNEGQMAWLSTGLNWYVRSKLAWNLKQNPADIEKDFCDNFFGPAARPMLSYYQTIENAMQQTNSHALSGTPDDLTALLPRTLMDKCGGYLADAQRLAATEPYNTRVAAFRGHYDRMDAYARARECMAHGDYEAAARWGDEMGKCVERVNNTMLLQEAGPWGGSLSGASVAAVARRVLPWTDGTKGKLIASLPPVAAFRADPASDGVLQRWYLPEASTKGGTHLRMTTAWHNQGVVTKEGRGYNGVAWYRAAMNLSSLQQGKARLLFPEVKGSGAWVWCNGKYAGMAEDSGDGNRTVNVSGLLKSGDNLIVIRVQGNGGLSLPPVLFTPTQASAFSDNVTDISAFPSEWSFRTDPQGIGEKEGWFKPDFVAGPGWRNLPVTTFWDDLIGMYPGDGWYRVRFRIPAEAKGKTLVLRFGAVDEEAWIYLNGELIGEHTTTSTGQSIHQIWDKSFDIPVRNFGPGQENILAVRVRNAAAAGGIFKPVRLLMIGD